MSKPVLGEFNASTAKKITPHIRDATRIKIDQILLKQNPNMIYLYTDLLKKCYDQIYDRDPNQEAANKAIRLPSLKIKKVGKRTIFINFSDICKIIGRDTEHVKLFICTEQSTNASIDAAGELCIGYRIDQSILEKIISKYIKFYVKCPVCGHYDTFFVKESRISYIICKRCTSKSSVKPIVAGYKADISKRKNRNKNAPL